MRVRNFILLLAILSTVSCKPRQKQPFGRNTELENKRWVLRELNGKPVTIAKDSQEMHIDFDLKDNTYGGSGTCNTMNGMYTVQDDMIMIHEMASTKMSCPELEKESEYFQMLAKANHYQLQKKKEDGVNKETLILFQEKTVIGKFERVVL